MLYFLGVSRIVPRIRYCRWLSGIMKRLLTPVLMSRDFSYVVVKVLPFVFFLTSGSALQNLIKYCVEKEYMYIIKIYVKN